MRAAIVLAIICLTSSANANWKDYPAAIDNMPEAPQRFIGHNQSLAYTMVGAANVLIGCLKGGIGSDKGFWYGCWRGSIGGAISFGGMFMGRYVGVSPWSGGSGKIIHDFGVSIQDNVAQDLHMFERIQFDIGPATVTWHGSLVPKLSYSLVAAAGIGTAIGYGGRFDWKTSIKTLTPVFIIPKTATIRENSNADGVCIGNTIVVMDKSPARMATILSHEFNHSLVWSDFRLAGNALNVGGWEVGRDAAYSLVNLINLNPRAYWYHPMELYAYTMER